MNVEEILARAILKVSQRDNLNLDALKKEQVPKRFWNKVLDELSDSKNSRGEAWTTKSLAAQWMRKKEVLFVIISNLHNVVDDTPSFVKSDKSNAAKPVNVGTDRDSPKAARPAKWNSGWDEHVKGFIQKEIKNAEDDLLKKVDERIEITLKDKTSSGRLNPDVPPAPPRQKRRMAGSKGHISARVDQNLLDLFKRDRDEKFEGNCSRCLNWILWNFYGKPALSFQASEDDGKQDPDKTK